MCSYKADSKKKRSRSVKIIKIAVVSIFAVCCITIAYLFYLIYKPNVEISGSNKEAYLYIKTGSDFDDVLKSLENLEVLKSVSTFREVAYRMKYPSNIKPGRYRLVEGMNNYKLVNMLRTGTQEPVKITFNNIRTKEQFIKYISENLEADSVSLYETFSDTALYGPWGFNSDNIMCMFIPNTYELYWNTNARSFFERMNKEYKKFWNESRTSKASAMNLSPEQVIILASIVLQETKKYDEMPRVAGVYMNRLKRNILLQADPTVIFAIGDFSIKRLLNSQLEFDSPYNTYKYNGLPPGPICLPDPLTIDKILDYEKHDYLFFCAKDDFSGYHTFARTNEQHLQNARRYHQALNRKNIME